VLFLKALAPLRGFGKNEIKPLMEKMVLGTPCYIPQGGFLSSGNILRYAERSVPGRSRKLHRAGEPGLLSGRNQRWRKPNQHIRKAVSHWH